MSVILLGDKTAAARWLAYAKSRAAALAKQGNNLSQTFSPAEGVTIRVQTLQGNPRVWIEAGGTLYATGGFDGNGILEIRTATRPTGPFNRVTKFPDYTTDAYRSVSHFQSAGDGRFAAVLDADGFGSPPQPLRVLMFMNASAVALSGFVDIGFAYSLDATPPYAIVMTDGQPTILSMDIVEFGTQPRLRRHDWKGALISDVELPFTVSGLETINVFGIHKVASQTLLLRGLASSGVGVEPFPFLLRSVDNGATWALVSPSEYPLAVHGSLARSYGFDPMADGGALGTGIIDEYPELGGPEVFRFASTFSPDTGASFGPYTIIGAASIYNPSTRPVALGGLAALQRGVASDGSPYFLRTEDAGATWAFIPAPLFEGFSVASLGRPLVFAVGETPATSKLVVSAVYNGVDRLYLSVDGGVTWTYAGTITESRAPSTVGYGYIVACGSLSRRLVPNPVIPDLYLEAT